MNLFTSANSIMIPGKELVYYFANWSEAIGIIGVNLYALITGYVCVHNKWRFSRYFRLWVLVAFYTVSLSIIGYILHKIGIVEVPSFVLHYGRFLFFGSTYWYFAAYTGLFFLMPTLNATLLNLSRKRFDNLVLILVFVLPILNGGISYSMMSAGYNMMWLSVLYVVGAYLKLYPPVRCRTLFLLIVSMVCTFIPLIIKLMSINIPVFAYTIPNNVVYSLALFVLFTRIRINSQLLKTLISILVPASFSVYLIQCHPWLWKELVADVPKLYHALDCPWWFSLVFGVALYLICSCIDFVRIALFRICRVNAVSDYVAGVIERIVKAILPKLKKWIE